MHPHLVIDKSAPPFISLEGGGYASGGTATVSTVVSAARALIPRTSRHRSARRSTGPASSASFPSATLTGLTARSDPIWVRVRVMRRDADTERFIFEIADAMDDVVSSPTRDVSPGKAASGGSVGGHATGKDPIQVKNGNMIFDNPRETDKMK